MQYYYSRLPKDKILDDFQKNQNVSVAIMRTAQDAFKPFEGYLKKTIDAQKKKADVTAKWRKVKIQNAAELKLIGGLYEISKNTIIKVLDNKIGLYYIENEVEEPDFEDKIKYKIGKEKFELSLSEGDYENKRIYIPQTSEILAKLNWGADTLALRPDWSVFERNEQIESNGNYFKIEAVNGDEIEIQGDFKDSSFSYKGKMHQASVLSLKASQKGEIYTIIKDESTRLVVSATKQPQNAKEIPHKNIPLFIDLDNICFEDGTQLETEKGDNEGLTIILKDQKDYGKIVMSNNIKFTVNKLERNNKDAYWIQLLEKEDEGADEIPGFSPLKYFFDDDIIITDNQKNEYSVVQGIESENKLILRNKAEKHRFGFPPDGTTLIVKVNTYNLEKQEQAIRALKSMPISEHANLIKLFEKRDVVRWENRPMDNISEWAVLKSDTRSGSKEQREFVQKALSTPDFAILEGPPGSGKTTVILEIICQLAKVGKKVLLCGSTHVAIDNVLERLQEKKEGKLSLLEQFHVLPVRIGDEKRINEDIKSFQINNLVSDNNIDENLLLDAANLVCGTTIGILQHPHFKKRDGRRNIEPIVPTYDYLIIDESSKTTFQEFLVPALYAKKWILAGDVMQLSPFTDRAEIVANLDKISISNNGKTFPDECQQAIFYLQKIKESLFAKNKFILPISEKVMDYMIAEMQGGRMAKVTDFLCCFITKNQKETGSFLSCTSENINTLALSAIDVIFIESNELSKVLPQMPETHLVLRDKNWQTSQHAFFHNHFQQKHMTFHFKEKGKEENNSIKIGEKINSFLAEKSWAEEIAWRIDREFQLRRIQGSKTANYQTQVAEYLPKNDSFPATQIEEEINQIAAMAFPSILESLVMGIKGRKTKHETTISKGFEIRELSSRRTILTYQHRMHPDISGFPRKQFYQQNGALLDLVQPKTMYDLRQWNYQRYAKRSVWVDVKGKTNKNYNEDEAKVMLRELEVFLAYAKQNPQPEGHNWEIACLTFYKGQESKIRERLQKLTGNEIAFSNFYIQNGKQKINIKLHNVDKFQGHEADIVFLSMVQTQRDGFLDNPNRLNVAITRAKFQLVIIGDYEYFATKSRSEDLKQLALNTDKSPLK